MRKYEETIDSAITRLHALWDVQDRAEGTYYTREYQRQARERFIGTDVVIVFETEVGSEKGADELADFLDHVRWSGDGGNNVD